jgi:hypothetical protein
VGQKWLQRGLLKSEQKLFDILLLQLSQLRGILKTKL